MKEKQDVAVLFKNKLLELIPGRKTAMFNAIDGQLAAILAVADEMKIQQLSAAESSSLWD